MAVTIAVIMSNQTPIDACIALNAFPRPLTAVAPLVFAAVIAVVAAVSAVFAAVSFAAAAAVVVKATFKPLRAFVAVSNAERP